MTRTAALRARTLGASLLALVGATTSVAPAGAFDTPAPAIVEGAREALAPDAFAAPDGSIWSVALSRDMESGRVAIVVTRLGEQGVLSRSEVAASDGPGAADGPSIDLVGRPQPLADGTVGMLIRRSRQRSEPPVSHVTDVRLTRVGSDGRVVDAVSLPQTARRAAAFAIEADGTVWWARSCEDELYRRTPAGRTAVVGLSRFGCGGDPERAHESGSTLALGGDGAVWLVNFCKRRIARLGPDGRLREWRPRRGTCWEPGSMDAYVDAAGVAVDPRGGIVFTTQDGGGRVLPGGRLAEDLPVGERGFVDDDGTYWFPSTRVAPDGRTGTPLSLPDGRRTAAVMPARGGGAWVVGSRATFVDDYKSSYWWYDDASAQLVSPDGSTRDWALPPMLGDDRGGRQIAGALTGPDGVLWVSYYDYRNGNRLYRVSPPDLPAARVPAARPTRITGRSGGVVSLQLVCAADVGRWCRGTARLGGAAAPARFLVAGGQRAAVRLTLGRRAADALRRRGRLSTTAIVSSDGAGSASRALVLRR